jgi:hypothetical protein
MTMSMVMSVLVLIPMLVLILMTMTMRVLVGRMNMRAVRLHSSGRPSIVGIFAGARPTIAQKDPLKWHPTPPFGTGRSPASAVVLRPTAQRTARPGGRGDSSMLQRNIPDGPQGPTAPTAAMIMWAAMGE